MTLIYVASLALMGRKALGNKCHQTNISNIISKLPLDPETSSMDVVVLGPNDMSGANGKKVQEAIDKKHPDVCVIYLYTNDKEKALLKAPYSKQAKKIKDTVIAEAVSEFYGDHAVRTQKTVVTSKDDVAPKVVANPVVEEVIPEAPVVESAPEVTVAPETLEEAMAEEPVAPAEPPKPVDRSKAVVPIEERLANVTEFKDWDLFMRQLDKEALTRRLIEESSEFEGVRNMLDVWDTKIRTTFQDPLLSDTEKFERIKEFGIKRATLKASENKMTCEKLAKVMTAIVTAADNTVKRRLDEVRQSIYTLAADKESIVRGIDLQPMFERRMNIQLELLETVKKLLEIYQMMDKSVTQQLSDMTKDLPSANAFINTMLFSIQDMFVPENAGQLSTMLMTSLQQNRVSMSAIKQSIEDVIGLLFKLGETDEEIIAYQQNIINVLRAQRVEDIVIRDSLIKDILRLYVGMDDTGRTSTVLTWSGIMARRCNTLIIDLTKNNKARQYGVEPVSLDVFLTDRIERPFLYVEGDVQHDPERVFQLMQELRKRINYYSCINVVLDETMQDELEQLSADALSVTYITDCSTKSVNAMREVITNHKSVNIARKAVLIDMPVEVTKMVEALGTSMTVTKIIPLPHLREMRACAICGVEPYKNEDIVSVFEEAFR